MKDISDLRLIYKPLRLTKKLSYRHKHYFSCVKPIWKNVPKNVTVNHNENVSQITEKVNFTRNLDNYDKENPYNLNS